jgi:hypothetical protein
MDWIVLRTSSWETEWKAEKGVPVKEGSGGQEEEGARSSLSRRVLIFLSKKDKKADGRS